MKPHFGDGVRLLVFWKRSLPNAAVLPLLQTEAMTIRLSENARRIHV
jgi:hypothetical protein